MKNSLRTLTVLAVAAGLATTADAGSYGKKHQDIIDTAIDAGTFQTLAAALKEADLVGALRADGPFTVFAPTDDAFAKLPAGTVESLLKPENRDRLVAVLTYHVVEGRLDAGDVKRANGTRTLNGQQLAFSTDGGRVSVDGAQVTAADVRARNGIIHVIDTVLLPESETIVGVAGKAGSFSTLLAAVRAAELEGALAGEGPFTVFAPTDEAFAKLPAGTVESLLLQENRAKLQSILQYHVVEGRVFSDEVVTRKSVGTLGGQDLEVSSKNGVAHVNQSKIVTTDIDASNGVIHVIDSVLLPPEQHSAAPSADDSSQRASL